MIEWLGSIIVFIACGKLLMKIALITLNLCLLLLTSAPEFVYAQPDNAVMGFENMCKATMSHVSESIFRAIAGSLREEQSRSNVSKHLR